MNRRVVWTGVCWWMMLGISGAMAEEKDAAARQGWRELLASENTCKELKSGFPERGVRTIYCHARGLADMQTLEKTAGMPIFLSGPHGKEMALKEKTDFGHYNPAFVQWLTDHAVPASGDEAFRRETQFYYDAIFKRLSVMYLAAAYKLESYPDYLDDEAGYLRRYMRGDAEEDPQYRYGDILDLREGDLVPLSDPEGKYVYDTNYMSQAGAFWVRRHMDGTFPLFKKLLEKLMRTYDAATLEALQAHDWSDVRLIPKERRVVLGMPGTYHGNEIGFSDKQRVYGFYREGERYVLKRQQVSITLVEDPIVDLEGEKSGKEVALMPAMPEEHAPLLLISAPFMENKIEEKIIVPTASYAPDQCLQRSPDTYTPQTLDSMKRQDVALHKECTLALGNDRSGSLRSYRLNAEKIRSWPMEAELKYKHTLRLSEEGLPHIQVLNNVMDILWAGDLDGDGKLDLLIDGADHYNVGARMRLYLSSYAPGGRLVGLAAVFESVGC